jgi:hypothetical protein
MNSMASATSLDENWVDDAEAQRLLSQGPADLASRCLAHHGADIRDRLLEVRTDFDHVVKPSRERAAYHSTNNDCLLREVREAANDLAVGLVQILQRRPDTARGAPNAAFNSSDDFRHVVATLKDRFHAELVGHQCFCGWGLVLRFSAPRSPS